MCRWSRGWRRQIVLKTGVGDDSTLLKLHETTRSYICRSAYSAVARKVRKCSIEWIAREESGPVASVTAAQQVGAGQWKSVAGHKTISCLSMVVFFFGRKKWTVRMNNERPLFVECKFRYFVRSVAKCHVLDRLHVHGTVVGARDKQHPRIQLTLHASCQTSIYLEKFCPLISAPSIVCRPFRLIYGFLDVVFRGRLI